MNTKMAEAATPAKVTGTAGVDQALGVAAMAVRSATGDLASILNTSDAQSTTHAAPEAKSLTQQGTAGWAAIGQSDNVELEEIACTLRHQQHQACQRIWRR